ncbi:hypothetical protein D3C87_1401100 [compost metagenome]
MKRRLLVLSVQIVVEEGEEGLPEIVQDLLNNNLTNSSVVVEEVSCNEIADENL